MNSDSQLTNSKCLICEGTTFTWGHVKSVYGPIAFVPRSVKGMLNALSNVINKDGEVPTTRVCDTCGNMQLFLEREALGK